MPIALTMVRPKRVRPGRRQITSSFINAAQIQLLHSRRTVTPAELWLGKMQTVDPSGPSMD